MEKKYKKLFWDNVLFNSCNEKELNAFTTKFKASALILENFTSTFEKFLKEFSLNSLDNNSKLFLAFLFLDEIARLLLFEFRSRFEFLHKEKKYMSNAALIDRAVLEMNFIYSYRSKRKINSLLKYPLMTYRTVGLLFYSKVRNLIVNNRERDRITKLAKAELRRRTNLKISISRSKHIPQNLEIFKQVVKRMEGESERYSTALSNILEKLNQIYLMDSIKSFFPSWCEKQYQKVNSPYKELASRFLTLHNPSFIKSQK